MERLSHSYHSYKKKKLNDFSSCLNELEDSPISIKKTYDKIGVFYKQLQDTVSYLDSKIGDILGQNEIEIMKSYKNTLENIDQLLNDYKKKSMEYENCKKKDEIIRSLKSELEFYKNEYSQLAKTSMKLRNEILQLTSENKTLNSETMFYGKRLKDIKRENKVLNASITKLSELNVNLPEKKEVSQINPYNVKFDNFIDSLLEDQYLDKKSCLEKCREYYCIMSLRMDNIVANLKQQMESERKLFQRFKGSQALSQASKGELQNLFLECVENAKKRLSRSNYDKRKTCMKERINDKEKSLIMDEFISNDKVANALYTTIFKPQNNLFGSMPVDILNNNKPKRFLSKQPSPSLFATNGFKFMGVKKTRFGRTTEREADERERTEREGRRSGGDERKSGRSDEGEETRHQAAGGTRGADGEPAEELDERKGRSGTHSQRSEG